ncbi:MAG TPA: right-handed parallel beta-helix repeat-containing protein [Rhodanobacteraceae bacterium]|nr:right-handed parallel beta-helix repeat-containing protein [Rhodanobacteraceae bacterium]
MPVSPLCSASDALHTRSFHNAPLSRAIRGALALTAVAGLALAPNAFAATYTVTTLADDGSAGTLRSAIESSNETLGADTITFASGVSGTITLTAGPLYVDDALTIEGPGADVLTIDGNMDLGPAAISGDIQPQAEGYGSVFYIGQPPQQPRSTACGSDCAQTSAVYERMPATLSGLTITGGSSANAGGAIVAGYTNLTVRDCVITGNEASAGGGIASKYGSLQLENSTISNNYAYSSGGGAFVLGNLTISNSTISGNSTGFGSDGPLPPGIGGGVFVMAKYEGQYESQESGALDPSQSSIVITGSSIRDNHAGVVAGGLFAVAYQFQVGSSTISGNTAGSAGTKYGEMGGGLFAGINGTVSNSTISGNIAAGGPDPDSSGSYTGGYGGGLTVGQKYGGPYSTYGGGTISLTNLTISNNTAAGGSAGGLATYGNVTITNSVIAGNNAVSANDLMASGSSGSSGPSGATGTTTSVVLSNSLLGTDPVTTYATIVDGGGLIVGVDPLLGPLASNGGPRLTMLPLPGSPLIDAGDTSAAIGPYDERGAPHARVVGAAVDIGAVEVQAAAPPAVTSVPVPGLGESGRWTLGGLLALAGLLLARRRKRLDPS